MDKKLNKLVLVHGYAIILLSILIACNNNQKEIGSKKKIIFVTGAKEAQKQVLDGEDFNWFFKKFISDSIFQKNRKSQKLVIKSLSENGEDYVIGSPTINPHRFLKFNEKAFELDIIKNSNNQYVVEKYINDSGFNISYFFNSKENLWALDSIIDSSW